MGGESGGVQAGAEGRVGRVQNWMWKGNRGAGEIVQKGEITVIWGQSKNGFGCGRCGVVLRKRCKVDIGLEEVLGKLRNTYSYCGGKEVCG